MNSKNKSQHTNSITKSSPLYNSTYSFVAEVNGKPMEFVSYEEYVDYIKDNPIEILERHYICSKLLMFQLKVVLYKRLSDNKFLVYKAVQYGHHKPFKQYYELDDYLEAYNKYKQLGGK